MSPSNFKHVAISAVVSALLAASQSGFAHTSVAGTSQFTEGTTVDVNLGIGHGCFQPNGTVKPVIAQSVVFPAAETQAAVDAGIIDGLKIDTIQNKDLFSTQVEKIDGASNLYAFSGRGGPGLATFARGRVPFQFSSGSIISLDSCVSEIHINLAVADICDNSKKLPNNPLIKAGKVNFWVPLDANGAPVPPGTFLSGNLNGAEMEHGPHIVVTRDLVNNPLPEACGGVGEELELTPTAEEINSGLKIDGYWVP